MNLLVVSKMDTASMNIASQLLINHDFQKTSERFCENPVYLRKLDNEETVKLFYIEQELVNTQSVAYPSPLRLLIFLSRHSSRSGTPTLSVHTPGNLGEASLGGLTRTVSIAPASSMKEALKAMKETQEDMRLDYQVSYECTHHGPSLNVPTMFVELGSSPKQWKDTRAAQAVARGTMDALTSEKSYSAVLGIGGPHYGMRFTKRALSSETAFGHMIPKFVIGELDEEMLRQCIFKTVEPVKKAVLDWKGIRGADKERLLSLLRKIDVQTERI